MRCGAKAGARLVGFGLCSRAHCWAGARPRDDGGGGRGEFATVAMSGGIQSQTVIYGGAVSRVLQATGGRGQDAAWSQCARSS